eukprot:scaffold39658_cov33-Cyclotella_meneghiniana.AAC.1
MDVNRLDLREEFKSCNVRELEGCNPVPAPPPPPPPPWATLGAKTLADDMEATLWAELRTLYPPPPPLLYRDPLEFLAEYVPPPPPSPVASEYCEPTDMSVRWGRDGGGCWEEERSLLSYLHFRFDLEC